ncbi:carbonyl reductase, putative [Talaromyces islandicus]|uniref:Carbonyl reductase, putative n=1 Tax=Talaromyces islandicus TaxID=28573 RepID=A0A0U1LXV9_TALIS|nr:carbonyl reductase, putative [Talaromyces islandicus]
MSTNSIQRGNFIHATERRAEAPPIWERFSLRGKTAIVTGGTSGIGWSVVQAFAEMGANVVIWYNTSTKGPTQAALIEQRYGVKCKAYQVDIQNAAAVQAAVDEHVQEFNGRLDIFVANAGIPWTKGAMVDGDLDHYHQVMTTDLDGPYYCAKAAAKHWRRQKEEGTDLNGRKLNNYIAGSFVATASMSGVIVNIPQLQASYNAAKAGVIHLCKSLAVEWARYARANSISPGYIITEISNFVPQETKDIWKDKIPLGFVSLPPLKPFSNKLTSEDGRVRVTNSKVHSYISLLTQQAIQLGQTY